MADLTLDGLIKGSHLRNIGDYLMLLEASEHT